MTARDAPTDGATRAPTRSWRVYQPGPPERALRLEPTKPRAPGPGEVRVAVRAVGLNYPDLLVCAGLYQERPEPPFCPGFEAAGEVVEVGPGARLSPGQRVTVVPELPNGALQESLTVPAEQVYPVPDGMPMTVAAVLHVAYETAHVALHHRAGLRPGDALVVTGAAGGVGSAAVQLGVAAGARVIAVLTGAAKAAACRRWGAHDVVDLAATPPAGLRDAIRDRTGSRGADVILDVVGGESFDQLRRAVAFEGRIVVVGFASGRIPELPANHVLLRNYSVLGLHLGSYRRADPQLLRDVHDQLCAGFAAGAVDPQIDRVLGIEEAVEGLNLIASREPIGRVVLESPGA